MMTRRAVVNVYCLCIEYAGVHHNICGLTQSGCWQSGPFPNSALERWLRVPQIKALRCFLLAGQQSE